MSSSTTTQQTPFLYTDNYTNWCCSLLTCIYQFLAKLYFSFPSLQVHVLVSLRAVLNVLILDVIRLFPETTGLDQNNNQLYPCLWPLPCTKTNQEGTRV